MALLTSATVAINASEEIAVEAGFFARHAKALAVLRSLAVSGLLALLTVVVVELVTRGSLDQTWIYFTSLGRPAWTTTGVFFLLYLAIDALIGRQHKAVLLVSPLVVLMGVISQQKQVFLTDPLYPTDLLFGRQILELMPVLVQDRPWTAALMAVAVLASVVGLVSLWVFAWRRFRPLTKKERLTRLAIALPLLAGFVSIMDYNQFSWVRDRLKIFPIMWDQAENYRHNGFVMAFAINLPMANVQTPAGYMIDAIDKIPSKPVPAGTSHRSKPDVIVVMSESLWDPTRLETVKLSADPMPVIRENQGGSVFSPEFGGLTANVEFEALTGFSNAFLPTGSIPYQQYVRKPIPSLATFFRAEGYTARAIHPFSGWFWNRTSVYKAFGFETFKDVEKMPPLAKRGNFTSDEALTRELIRQADMQEDPFFFFTVTLQGHGPYDDGRYAKTDIDVDGQLDARSNRMLASYAQGVKEADSSLKMLMDWAKTRDRETIIVVFGDHLPPLNTVYKNSGYMKGVTASRKGSPEQMKKEHETPLVIWSNKSGAQKEIGTISPAFLSYYVLKEAGFEHPYYTGFLGAVHDRLRVIDRYMLIDAKGNGTADWARKKTIDPLVRDFRFLQHDIMFGKQYGLERFFNSHAELMAAGS
ncbi:MULTISPECIES: LTA synthase family protein [Shinella]|uniref:Phosphoglycerol transferase MdoB-like AlkP superfamily enzyme n=1 Tax=Shinella granuli TaxID=323621 RepID=A0A4R2CP35_SHIGR|nr:phosphoglycerol transferase MdoB-like AlkP superfamily enzyme [Shinella granuli]